MTGYAAQIDLGKDGAKWKHGWIPLNAAAMAILHAKADHGASMSPGQMHALSLDDLKKHYSTTIKAHGFQHPYTKKVGKAVGSHPTALAVTKAKADAKKAVPAAAPKPPEPPKPSEAPKPPEPHVDPTPPTTAQILTKLMDAHAGHKIQPVYSTTGAHIGHAVLDASPVAGKKHTVYNLKGEHAGHVNSFTGAQLVLGEKNLGKPNTTAAAAPSEPKKPHEQVGANVSGIQELKDAPVGTKIAHHNDAFAGGLMHWVKGESGVWHAESSPEVTLENAAFSGTVNKGKVQWAGKGTPPTTNLKVQAGYQSEVFQEGVWAISNDGGAPVGTVMTSEDGKEFAAHALDPQSDDGESIHVSTHSTAEAAAAALIKHYQTEPNTEPENVPKKVEPPKKAKPPKIEPDPAPPTHPGAGTPGWSVRNESELDAAPAGTTVSDSFTKWVKNEDGTWTRSYKSGSEWKESIQSYYGTKPNVTGSVFNVWYWGDAGQNNAPPEGYTGPRYGIEEYGSGWAVKDYYNGGTVDIKNGKPNAAKVANDKNLAAGTLTAKQRKLAATQKAKFESTTTAGGTQPSELEHPTVPVGTDPSALVHLRFNGSKAGDLGAEPVGFTTTPNDQLFGQWGAASTAKKNVARQIGDRMAHHDGYDNQDKLDAAWASMVTIGALATDFSGPPEGFIGYPDDPFYANAVGNGDAPIKRGTEEYRRVMREKMVASMVQWWAQSSNDDHAITLSLQNKAAKHFGIEDYQPWKASSAVTAMRIAALENDKAFQDLAASFLQSQYDAAQAALASRGITHVTVRRGVKTGVAGLKEDDVGALKMRPMSSWSTNPATAQNFGSNILQTTVPREKIIGFAGYGFGCLNEYEVVVLGGRTTAKVIKKS